MGTGYTRQSAADIIAGADIDAGPLNAEFNQLRDAFDAGAGHSHDGSTGEGPKIDLTTSVTGILPVTSGGTGGINNLTAVSAPTVGDDTADGYTVGSVWIDVSADVFYVCIDATLGAAIWRRFQPYDAELVALAGLTSVADKGIYFTGVGTAATYDLTSFARTLLDDANAAAFRTTLGVAIGTNVQAFDATLAALAAYNTNGILVQTSADTFAGRTVVGPAAGISLSNGDGVAGNPTLALANDLAALEALAGTNTMYYRSAADTWTAVTFDPSLLFSAGTLSVVASSLDPELAAIAGLVSAADKGIYYTGSGTASLFDLSAFARTFLDDANASAVRTTLGAQAQDADLDAIAALTPSNDDVIQRKAGAWTNRTIAQLTADLTTLAPLASPTFTGVPAAPTAAGGTNTTQIATTAFVTTALSASTSVGSILYLWSQIGGL